MITIKVPDVNYTLAEFYTMVDEGAFTSNGTRRGARVEECREPVVTEYQHPACKVLFDPVRDANPFFHLFESIWIFAGSDEVGPLARFLPSIVDYSDNGTTFNAAYGQRIRFEYPVDQLLAVVDILRRDPGSRRAFMVIGDPEDLVKDTKDVACNVSVFFNMTPNVRLDMTVNNRSNDAIWGAYGANAVQFGSLHQLICEATGLAQGVYRQFSNNFHYYVDNPAVKKVLGAIPVVDKRYGTGAVRVQRFIGRGEDLTVFLEDCHIATIAGTAWGTAFFRDVANPMIEAFGRHKNKDTRGAIARLEGSNVDWLVAGREWLQRRLK